MKSLKCSTKVSLGVLDGTGGWHPLCCGVAMLPRCVAVFGGQVVDWWDGTRCVGPLCKQLKNYVCRFYCQNIVLLFGPVF